MGVLNAQISECVITQVEKGAQLWQHHRNHRRFSFANNWGITVINANKGFHYTLITNNLANSQTMQVETKQDREVQNDRENSIELRQLISIDQ